MKLLEIKNNLAKLSYTTEDGLALGGFITLSEKSHSYVAQIVNLKAEVSANYAIAKLIFTFNSDGIVDNYDGTIPTLKAEADNLNASDILNLLPIEKPVRLGNISNQDTQLSIDESVFEKNFLICAERLDNISNIVKKSSEQLAQNGEKIIIIDVDHSFSEIEPVRFKRDFKLPLSSEMIDYIYDNDLEEVEASSKAVIQDIFYEVQEFVRTVKDNFIPFKSFLDVVSEQYKQTNMPELALLKHKLLRYGQNQVFAQSIDEVDALKDTISSNSVTYIDIGDVDDALQKKLISYIHSVIDSSQDYVYVFVKLTNHNADKKLLKQILENEHIFTTIICSHSYKYLAELKQRAENIIFFAPQTFQHDFATYNTFLNKLNPNEFVIYGALTQNIPFIVELTEDANDSEISDKKMSDYKAEETPQTVVSEVEEEPQTVDFEEFTTIENENNAEEFSDEADFADLENTVEDTQTIENILDISQDDELPVAETQNFDFVKNSEHDELVEQVAKDVDEVLYNKIEDTPSIEDITSDDTLTEDDLDMIDSFDTDVAQVEEEVITEAPNIEEIETDFEVDNMQELTDVEMSENSEDDILQESSTQTTEEVVPVYQAETPIMDGNIELSQGDTVSHPKYGRGVIEKLIKYGNKTLCSISFENVGRRLLDPAISDLTKEN